MLLLLLLLRDIVIVELCKVSFRCNLKVELVGGIGPT